MNRNIAKPLRLKKSVKDLAQKMAAKLVNGDWLYIVSSTDKEITFKLRSGHNAQNPSKADPSKIFSGVAKVMPTETAWVASAISVEKPVPPEPKAEKQPDPEKPKTSWKEPEKEGKSGKKQ